jgi:hypothetical protein
MKIKHLFFMLLAIPMVFAACEKTPEPEPQPEPEPVPQPEPDDDIFVTGDDDKKKGKRSWLDRLQSGMNKWGNSFVGKEEDKDDW